MGFQLKPSHEGYFYPINLPVITENGASRIDRFEMKFKRISRTKINELQRLQEEQLQSELELDTLERDLDYVMEVSEGWRQVSDADGEPMEFSRENIRRVLDEYPSAAGVIVKAFFESTLGGGAKRKN